MNPMKKAAAVSTLSIVLLLPGIAQADTMKPMDSGRNSSKAPNMMMEQNKMMGTGNQTDMMMMNGIAYVPLRLLAETLGYMIMWNGDDQSITLTYMGMDMGMGMDMDMSDNPDQAMKDMYTVKVMLDSKDIMVGMDKKMLAHAPIRMNGKTYVTKDFISMYLLAPFMMKSM
ncbi:copper amine oxidase N-terminal domain-containing protein [Paenibacillus rhizophilus]|uniref:Copper amine oxidase N-terminal domain-containing protein n=1 Tax=Paenibacillus rhizophilus TaxID=1850366 RepID=A0A3N9PV76_9BACL|nr:copper amine oxidase N-terminal domain-containing protein [Paenibacillus rhizophilus]RQW09146.1 copper amine oxidase N-terminal domain-containing protein [Paenibacillus rhizophilus]